MLAGSFRSTSKYPKTCADDLPSAALIAASTLPLSVGTSAHPSYCLITSMPLYGEQSGTGLGARPPTTFSGLPMDTQETWPGSGAEAGSCAQRRSAV